jgi:hypothetical protein
LFGVSERDVYRAIDVMRLRPDLVPDVEAGHMSLDEAYGLAFGKPTAAVQLALISMMNVPPGESVVSTDKQLRHDR